MIRKNLSPTMKRIKLILLAAFFNISLAGCASDASIPEFGAMSTRYAEIFEQYQINMIFQNIVRSVNGRPLSFLDIPSINGSGSVSLAPSASGIFNGGANPVNAVGSNILGGLASISPNLGLTVGKSVNVSQSSLDNSVFWRGFLTTLPQESLGYFSHNRFPRELLYSLILDEIQIQTPDGVVHSYVNNPLDENHPEFQRQMYQLISNGLTPQFVITSTKVGGVISESRLQQMYGLKYRQVLEKDNLSLIQIGPESARKFQILSTDPGYKFCLNKSSYVNFAKDIARSDYCQVAPLSANQVQESSPKGARLYLKTRSTSSIYGYLGQVVKAQNQPKPYLVSIPPINAINSAVMQGSTQFAVLIVKENTKEERSFAYIDDNLSGVTYLIPGRDAGYSRQTIEILSAFQTLLKVPGSVPTSPSVLIR